MQTSAKAQLEALRGGRHRQTAIDAADDHFDRGRLREVTITIADELMLAGFFLRNQRSQKDDRHTGACGFLL